MPDGGRLNARHDSYRPHAMEAPVSFLMGVRLPPAPPVLFLSFDHLWMIFFRASSKRCTEASAVPGSIEMRMTLRASGSL